MDFGESNGVARLDGNEGDQIPGAFSVELLLRRRVDGACCGLGRAREGGVPSGGMPALLGCRRCEPGPGPGPDAR